MWELFNTTRSVFVGPVVLEVLFPTLRDADEPNPVHAITPFDTFFTVLAHFIDIEEGQVTAWDINIPGLPRSSYAVAVEVVTYVGHIHLIRSTSNSAFLPIPYFCSTHLMNVIHPSGLLVAYPDLTFKHQAVLREGWDIAQPRPYSSGFIFNDRALEPPYPICLKHVLCHQCSRRFRDTYCAQFAFDGVSAYFHGDHDVTWWLGGPCCAVDCAGGGAHEVLASRK